MSRESGGRLAGRAAVITGASRGLGAAIARAFVTAGAKVMLVARNQDALVAARRDLLQIAPAQNIRVFAGDITLDVVARELVARTQLALGEIDVLVNNAGVQGPIMHLARTHWSEWLHAISTDLATPAMLMHLLLPQMIARDYGKVINISGGGATKPMPGMSAYAAAKAGLVRMSETVALEVRPHHIDVNCVAPGALNTRMQDEVLAAGATEVGAEYYNATLQVKRSGGASPQRAADLCVFLASSESDGLTGKLISAVWDPWESFSNRVDELNSTPIYTLRRVSPED